MQCQKHNNNKTVGKSMSPCVLMVLLKMSFVCMIQAKNYLKGGLILISESRRRKEECMPLEEDEREIRDYT